MANDNTTTDIQTFRGASGFELAQRQAKALSVSGLVPEQYRGNVANCLLALDLSQRIGASVLAVMQESYIVHGKPSWSSKFIAACINSCGKFSPLRFDVEDLGQKTVKGTKIHDKRCVAWAKEKDSGERLESPPVTIEMAVLEGWYSKNGSKWQTMPDLMLRYRAATFFGRLYAPELFLGMQSAEEVHDLGQARQVSPNPFMDSAADHRPIVEALADDDSSIPDLDKPESKPDAAEQLSLTPEQEERLAMEEGA